MVSFKTNVLFLRCASFLKNAQGLKKIGMYIHGDLSSGDRFIVACGPDIWAFDMASRHYSDEEDLPEAQAKLFKDLKSKLGADAVKSRWVRTNDPSSFFSWLSEERPDVLQCQFDSVKKTMWLHHSGTFRLSPTSSLLVKKVMQQLGAKQIDHSDSVDEETISHQSEEVKGDIPNDLFHGTNLSSAVNIVRHGLMPKPEKTNYKQVVHDDCVFLTSHIDEAAHHASVAAKNTKEDRSNKGVVFVFSIPDKSKIIPDYDVDINSSETLWSKMNDTQKNLPNRDSYKLTKEVGLFGYRGRIPASFIKDILFLDLSGAMHEVSKEDLFKIWDFGGEYGALFYRDDEEEEELEE